MLKELIAVLEDQTDLHRSLLEILHQEKKALVHANLAEVNAVRFKKETILSLIHEKDDRRKLVVTRISDCLGCPPLGLTLTQLAQRVEVPFSLKLIQCAADISSLVKDIHKENEINKSLITHSLKLIRSSINMIVQLMTPPPVYFRTGKIYQGEICGTVLSSSV